MDIRGDINLGRTSGTLIAMRVQGSVGLGPLRVTFLGDERGAPLTERQYIKHTPQTTNMKFCSPKVALYDAQLSSEAYAGLGNGVRGRDDVVDEGVARAFS